MSLTMLNFLNCLIKETQASSFTERNQINVASTRKREKPTNKRRLTNGSALLLAS